MNNQIAITFLAFFAVCAGVFVPPHSPRKHVNNALELECTWGPSFWCKNISTAANCHAVKHCIQTVWLHKQLPPDNSDVCQTCLEMVKEARDTLLSNDTQELIKEVFEGSCALLRFKPVVEECDKIADEFIPQLVDTLASEMNPQVVCSVAGLCNNERYLKLVEEEKRSKTGVDDCDGCHTVVGIMEKNLNSKSRDQILQSFLQVCRTTGSLSDGCANIMITYFNDIYNHLKKNFKPNEFCLMSGVCSQRFHVHANVEITPMSQIGYVKPDKQSDDLPCDLCKQLVTHLRDLLITNTTKDEFKRVLVGLCSQTRQFKDECLGLVDEYYAVAYDFLVDELDSNEVCNLAGLCPSNNTQVLPPLMPLLPERIEILPSPKIRINMAKNGAAVKILESPEEAQLPIDLLTPKTDIYNKETCVFCEYFLHYIQEVITSPKSEVEIKDLVDKACSKLPATVNETCKQFVDMYEPALVAILAQEIDPSTVCPLIKACPAANIQNVEVFMQQTGNNKCSMCLLAVQTLEDKVKNKNSEANIRKALNSLCDHLPASLAPECIDFVNTYTDELVEMLVADLTPQEVCTYLKLCDPKKNLKPEVIKLGQTTGDTNTNHISDNTVNGKALQVKDGNSNCVLCEFVLKEIQDELKDNKTDETIKTLVHNICNVMPRSILTECNEFVDKYADTVIQLLIASTDPAEVCQYLGLCTTQMKQVKVEIFECAVCEALVYAAEKILENPKVDHNIDHVLKKACRALPTKDQSKCQEIIDQYGKTIYDLITHLADKGVICKEVLLCSRKVIRPIRHTEGSCAQGTQFSCLNMENALLCNSVEACEKIWKNRRIVGLNKCTYGPSYWCDSNENAAKCGATEHCQQKVWKASSKPKK